MSGIAFYFDQPPVDLSSQQAATTGTLVTGRRQPLLDPGNELLFLDQNRNELFGAWRARIEQRAGGARNDRALEEVPSLHL